MPAAMRAAIAPPKNTVLHLHDPRGSQCGVLAWSGSTATAAL